MVRRRLALSGPSTATHFCYPASAPRPRVSAVFILFAIVLACADNFADPDLWGHLLIGKAILSTGHIPSHDAYSYTVAGFPTRNHEWLAEVVFAAAYNWCGVVGLKLVKLACATIAISALAAGLARTAASARIQRTILVLTAGGLTTQMQFRPQLFTFAMLSIVMTVLAAEIYGGRARLWPLVPMFALWANFHGGFTVGLGAMGIAAIVLATQEILAGNLPWRGFRLGCVTLLAALATMVNPAGIGLWTTVLHSVSDPLLRAIIKEWVSLPTMMVHLWYGSKIGLVETVLPLGLFAAFLCAMVIAPTLDDAPLTVIAIIFAGAAFYMVRNLALGVIAIAIPLAHHVAFALAKRARSNADAARADSELSPALIAIVATIVAVAGGLFSTRLPTWEPVPARAVAFMRDHNLRGNILNHFEWGNYVEWHLPQDPIFIDTRTELAYPDTVIRKYAEFFYGKPGAWRALDDYRTDFVLTKSAAAGSQVVKSDPAWKIVYQDSVATLFAPAASPIEGATEGPKLADSERTYFP